MKQNKAIFKTQIPEVTQYEIERRMEKSILLAEKIKTIMDARQIKNVDLAGKLGIQPSTISKWLTGFHNFTWSTILRIEHVLEEEIVSLNNFNEAFSIEVKIDTTVNCCMPVGSQIHNKVALHELNSKTLFFANISLNEEDEEMSQIKNYG